MSKLGGVLLVIAFLAGLAWLTNVTDKRVKEIQAENQAHVRVIGQQASAIGQQAESIRDLSRAVVVQSETIGKQSDALVDSTQAQVGLMNEQARALRTQSNVQTALLGIVVLALVVLMLSGRKGARRES